MIIQSNELTSLRAIFSDAGFDLWFVGGCVRDSLLGQSPKDIDLATSATPDEQLALYEANGLHFIPTGLQHGTVTVVLDDEPYEITSLRTESEHDGRYATMAYTRDINEDLSRRDLTVNAMAWDFDGNLIDPFGGADDLSNKRVRFVGNAEERMREDYLRILRFFRFHGRIAGEGSLCEEATSAIKQTRGGLQQISVERIWSEIQRIVTGPAAEQIVDSMRNLLLLEIIGMPYGMASGLTMAKQCGVTAPASVMGVYVTDVDMIDMLADDWKWSTAERQRARFVRENLNASSADPQTDIRNFKRMLVDGTQVEWVSDLMRLKSYDPDMLTQWEVPTMPVSGADLIDAGVKPGPEMGALLKDMRERWVMSDFTLKRDDLLTITMKEES